MISMIGALLIVFGVLNGSALTLFVGVILVLAEEK